MKQSQFRFLFKLGAVGNKKILKDHKNVFHISIKIWGSENIFERFKPTSFVIEAQTQQIVHLVTLTPTLPVEEA